MPWEVTRPSDHGRSPRSYTTTLPLYIPRESVLHLLPDQCLYRLAVEGLPGRLPYGDPRLAEVGRPLYDLVAREDNQLERLRGAVSCLFGIVGFAPKLPLLD